MGNLWNRCAFCCSASVLVTVALSQPAFAQSDGAPQQTEAEQAGNPEILVTAQRREERLRDVPVAVSVVTGPVLEQRNMTSVSDLRLAVPSLSFDRGTQIRGVGTVSFSRSVEASVGTVIDDVVIARPFLANNNLFDMDRVEVLRGPQGMLFGRNATAGVVAITTKRPQLGEASGSAYAFYDDTESGTVQVVGNAPLGQNAAVRVNTYVNRTGPYGTNVFRGEEYGDRTEWGLKGKFLFEPSADVSLLLTGEYSEGDGVTPAQVQPLVTGSNSYYATTLLNVCGIVISAGNRDICEDGVSYARTRLFGVSGVLDVTLGTHKLTTVIAYRSVESENNNTSDSLPTDVFNLNLADQPYRQFTAEVRLASPGGQRLEYVFGAFYLKDSGEPYQDQGGQFAGTVFALPAGQHYSGAQQAEIDGESIALFGQMTFRVTDSLKLIAGGRQTWDRLRFSAVNFTAPGGVALNAVFPPFTLPEQRASESDFSWRLGAQLEVTPTVNSYLTVSRGYKGPAFNQFGNLPGRDPLVKPETVTNYELGFKGTFFDRAFDLNIAAFYQVFRDFQAEAFDLTTTPPAIRTLNAGRLESKGIEVEYAVRSGGFTLSGGATYLDAHYREFLTNCYGGQTVAQGCVSGRFDAAGQRLSVPRFIFTSVARYDVGLGGTLRGFAQGDIFHRSSVNPSVNQDPGTFIKGYTLLGARIGIETESGLSVFVFAENLTNERYYLGKSGHAIAPVFGALSGQPQAGYYVGILGDPRTLGAGMRIKF